MREFQIIQNEALGALAIYSFAKEYTKHERSHIGPPLTLAMPVLPLVFNARTCKILWDVKRITNARFLNTLSGYRDLPAGLQDRMVQMADNTFKALNFGFGMKILRYDPQDTRILAVPHLKKLPKLYYGDNQMIVYGGKVLGCWFANYSIEEICISLNIYF
jgi:hypothetical protein